MFKLVDVTTMIKIKQIVDFSIATSLYLIFGQMSPEIAFN